MRQDRRNNRPRADLPGAAVWRVAVTLLALAALPACVINAESAEPLPYQTERAISSRVTVPAGVRLEVENLAGIMRIEATTGSEVEIQATVHAGGDDDGSAEALAGSISLEVDEDNERVLVRVSYPVAEYDEFHYARDGESGFLGMFGGSETQARYMGRKVRVSTSRRGNAASVYADVVVRLPAGVEARVMEVLGRVEVDGVVGNLAVEVDAGAIDSVSTEGKLSLDTGSGSVDVKDHRGDLLVDTGSGSVDIRGVQGETRVDTGSGDVNLIDIDGPFVGVDTGSGSVTLEGVSGSLDIDTGSGSIGGKGLVSGASVSADTGSGRVILEGDFAAADDIMIDTSSGRVELVMSAWASLRIDLNTGSGQIDVDLPDLTYKRQERDRVIAQLGDGDARLVVDTGSGGISVRSQ